MGWSAVEIEAARSAFDTSGRDVGARDVVAREALRPEVLASWVRSREAGVDAARIGARFLGHTPEVPPVVSAADHVFDEFVTANPGSGCSQVLLDSSGIVRCRRDDGPELAAVLDGLLVVPGYGYAERQVGTTAATVALHERADVAIGGAEHYHWRLAGLAGAGAVVTDPHRGEVCAAVWLVGPASERSALQLPLARMLADRITERMAAQPHRRTRAVLDALERVRAADQWVLATDGDLLVSSPSFRRLSPTDQRVVSDLVLSALVLGQFGQRHVELPSGACAEVTLQPIHLDGEIVGCVLGGGPTQHGEVAETPEAVRRQGSHVAPLARRDYTKDAGPARTHADAKVRANRELLSPYLRARQEVVASIHHGRNHLLIGEPGVGKRTLVTAQFRAAYPSGRVVSVDCSSFTGRYGVDPVRGLAPTGDGRPQLLVLSGMTTLSPVGARQLDEALRPLVALETPPLVVGCVDSPAVDATSPYGLLLRHFHEVTRIPALRYRADEISELALTVLRRVAGRCSLRLSLQVIRVLEGYAWPGNISELEDVMRYVVARKTMGEVQPTDLPPLCFQGRARRMSMLESAQCDAIIQALYESNGNRYKAAAMLGIARSSLYRKIDAFGISYIA